MIMNEPKRSIKMNNRIFLGVLSLLLVLGFSGWSHAQTTITQNITTGTTWDTAGSPYVVDGNISINTGITLTIDPGVVVKFEVDRSLTINGTLSAIGTDLNKIVFTSIKDDTVGGDTNGNGGATAPAPGDWDFIKFGASSLNSQLEEVEYRFSDFGIQILSNSVSLNDGVSAFNNQYAIDIQSASPTITNFTMENNTVCGILISGGTPVLTGNTIQNNDCGIQVHDSSNLSSINNNAIQNNTNEPLSLDGNGIASTLGNFTSTNTLTGNGFNGIGLSGFLTQNATLTKDPNLPYILKAKSPNTSGPSLDIGGSTTLTIDAGVIIKAELPPTQNFSDINVNGTFLANGTENDPVFFTSILDDVVGGDTNGDGNTTTPAKGDWGSLFFQSSSSNSVLDHIVLRYSHHFLVINSDSTTIQNSTLQFNDFGISISDASPTIMNNIIQNIDDTGAGNPPITVEATAAIYVTRFDPGSNPPKSFPTIQGNTIWENNNHGIYVHNNASPTIQDNVITQNGGDGIHIQSGFPNISNNIILGNQGFGTIMDSNANTISAENNYWGHSTGPLDNSDDTGTGGLFNPNGQGSPVSDFIDYDPFLTDEPFAVTVRNVSFQTAQTKGKEEVPSVPLTVVLTPAAANTITVDYSASGTATGGGVDFTLPNSTLTFNPGETEKTINLVIVNDNLPEPVEKINVNLSNPTNVTIGAIATHTYSITEETVTTYEFDSVGNLITAEDENSKLTLTYDQQGRILSTSTTGSSNQPSVQITYTYDAYGNRLTMNDGIEGVTNYTYDGLNRLTSITNPTGQSVNYEFDPLNRQTKTTFSNGVVGTYVYDANNNLTSLTHTLNNSTVSSVSYPYDAGNQRTGLNTQRPVNSAQTSLIYLYDDLGRLVLATDPVSGNDDQTFDYDPVGNRLSEDNQTLDSIFDDANRLQEDDKFEYEYDVNGNATRREDKDTGEIDTMTYDGYDRLITVEKRPDENSSPTDTIFFIYDPMDRRIGINSGSSETIYIYDNEDILWEYDENQNNPRARYTHGIDRDEPHVMDRDGTEYFYIVDGLGNIIDLTNNQGAVQQSYLYDSYGNFSLFDGNGSAISNSSGIANPYTFTGREFDTGTGFFYYRARYYDPFTGRFVSEDPLGFEGEDINLYRYVYNSPINLKDPDGTIPAALAVPLAGGLINGWGDASQCKGNVLEKFAAFGKGFLSGAVGAVAGLVTGSLSGGNPFAAGAVSSATSKYMGNLLRGRKTRFKELLKAGVKGGFGNRFTTKLIPNRGINFSAWSDTQRRVAQRTINSSAGQLGKKCGC